MNNLKPKVNMHFLFFYKLLLTVYLSIFSFSRLFSQADNKYYLFKNNYPNNKSLFWGDNDAMTNGITHDNNNWYITTLGVCHLFDFCTPGTPNDNWSIRRIRVEQDLATGAQSEEWVKSQEPALASYGHAGDLDHFQIGDKGYLAVPVTGGTHPAIAFFSTNPIRYINYAYLKLRSDYQRDVGWCAFSPDGYLYTSNDNATAIYKYKIDWPKLFAPSLDPTVGNLHNALLLETHYPLEETLHNMQGGEFTPDGKLLYINCGIISCLCHGTPPHKVYRNDGIHVLETTNWKDIKQSTSNVLVTDENCSTGITETIRTPESGCFDYTFDNSGCSGEEPEGLTIWDLDDGRAPNIRGQLHVISYNHNDFFVPGGDNNRVILKHYQRVDEYDECSTAKKLSSCNTIIATTDCATISKSIPPISGYSGKIKDVWFTIDKPNAPSFSIETSQVAGGLTHTVMQVLSGTCGHLHEIESDNGSNNGGHAKVTISGYTGSWPLYIRVTDYGANDDGKFGIYYKKIATGSKIFSQEEAIFPNEGSSVLNRAVLTGDVNNDGKTDLIFQYKNSDGDLCIRTKISNGDGGFTTIFQNLGDRNAVLNYRTLTGDINGDGRTDLILTYLSTENKLRIRVKLSDGTGHYYTPPVYPFISELGSSIFDRDVLTGDVNNDGKTDIIFQYKSTTTHKLMIRTLISKGNGDFESPAGFDSGDSDIHISHPTLTGDIDGDGKTDLILTYYYPGHGLTVRVKLSNGNGTFRTPDPYVLGDANYVFDQPVLTGDVDGDHKTDLIFLGQDWNTNTNLNIRVKFSNGDGSFRAVSKVLGDSAGLHTYPTLTGDVNADGKTDLIFTGENWTGCGLNIRVKISDGLGGWCPDWQVTGDGSAIFNNSPVLTGDINNDGKTDLVFAFSNSSNQLVVRSKITKSNYTCNAQDAGEGTIIDLTDFLIYPNPSNNYFQIKSQDLQIVQLKIINALGTVVVLYPKFNTDIDRADVRRLQSGIYFVEILNTETGKRSAKRLVKIN